MSLWKEFEDPSIVQAYRDFARTHVQPVAAEIDREDRYPADIVDRAAELGFNALIVP